MPEPNWFVSLDDARRIIEDWRVDYNTVRPHSSVGYRTPEEFAADTAARPASPPAGRFFHPGVDRIELAGVPVYYIDTVTKFYKR